MRASFKKGNGCVIVKVCSLRYTGLQGVKLRHLAPLQGAAECFHA